MYATIVLITSATNSSAENDTSQENAGESPLQDNEEDIIFEGVYYSLGDEETILIGTINDTNTTDNLSDLISSSGNVVISENGGGVYVQLDDNVIHDENVKLIIKELKQGEIFLDVPVEWYQEIVIENKQNENIKFNLNLWNYQNIIPKSFLNDVTAFSFYIDGELISETPIASFTLEPFQRLVVSVVYQTPSVSLQKNCGQMTILDLIPFDANLISSELDINARVGEVCRVKIFHHTLTHYKDIKLTLDDISISRVQSVYYIEGGKYLEVRDGEIIIPEKHLHELDQTQEKFQLEVVVGE
ncbi:hypothetical protein JW868_04380 [Candidatus Woesearchaeota archaeon]|nr:hypothetical protein [Candidatus Woesearchaeota archaeon]